MNRMVCRKCGAFFPEGARFCPYCGAPLESEAAPSAPRQDSPWQQPGAGQFPQPVQPLQDGPARPGKAKRPAAQVLGIVCIVFATLIPAAALACSIPGLVMAVKEQKGAAGASVPLVLNIVALGLAALRITSHAGWFFF